jgi:hypothetical protein
MDKIKKNKDALLAIATSKKAIRNAIIDNGNKELINAVCECCLNVLNGNIPLNDEQKKVLYKDRHKLRKIIKSTTIQQKKKLLKNQSGGFLNLVIPAAITGIASIISSIISRKDDT